MFYLLHPFAVSPDATAVIAPYIKDLQNVAWLEASKCPTDIALWMP